MSLPTAGNGIHSPPIDDPMMRNVVRVSLRSHHHSAANRHRARELAWQWVAAKWPRLVPSREQMERHQFAHAVPGQQIVMSSAVDHSSWSLAIAFDEKNGARTWITQVEVVDDGAFDVLRLQTSCTGVVDAPLVVAPPRLLGSWVERMQLDDGPFAVLGEPREVNDANQLQGFLAHVLSHQRTLPVIALANRPQTRFYGVDPRGLATAVRGLAHVICLDPAIATEVAEQLGPRLGVVPGAARIYSAKLPLIANSHDHPLIRNTRVFGTAQDSAGAFRRQLCQKICAMSVREHGDDAALNGTSGTPRV
ncbi:MAG: hypothetical protein ABI434_05015 [Burkholderiaceae bacterium]